MEFGIRYVGERLAAYVRSLGAVALPDLDRTLFPADERKGKMAANELKVCFITGNQRRANTACGQRDQDIEGQVSDLRGIIMFTVS